MVVVFALAAAVLYGSADFLGGVASRRTQALSVLMVSGPVGAAVLVVAALLAGAAISDQGLAWGFAAGAVGGIGLIVFYAGLAAGPISVVAPVSALMATVLPVGVAVAAGERPGAAVYVGAVACVVAIALVGMDGHAGGRSRAPRAAAHGFGYGMVAGTAFGIFFLFLRDAGGSGLLWPVVASRAAGSVVILGAAAWFGARPVWGAAGRRVFAVAAAAGVLDASANVCYLLATRAGLFGVAVLLTSLYPGITVLLARILLGERIRAVQRLGLVLAAAGVALVVA